MDQMATGTRMNNPVILADGDFPVHVTPLTILATASPLVCCDGAADALAAVGVMPDLVIGDLDSISPAQRERFQSVLVEDRDQETNDLTKAVNWCRQRGIRSVTILGATGKREDHTLANIALLARYNRDIRAEMVTDHGTFSVVRASCEFPSVPGQQISIFSLTPETAITSTGLKYPLSGMTLAELWQGSLNEATGETFSLAFTDGILAIYRLHPAT
jgi:thiamine pyrophosphokinase